MGDIIVRPAVNSDAPAVADLAGQLGYPTTTGQADRRFAGILDDRGQAFLVAEKDRVVIGWIHVHVTRLVEAEPFAELGGLVVDESHRGQGAGRLLMVAAEDWIRANCIAKLRVRTRADRHDAHAFYEARGYALIKEQRIYDKEI